MWGDLRLLDGTIDPSDREIGVCYLGGNPRFFNYSPYVIGSSCTLRTWLSMWSLRTSQCRGAPHLRRITVPSLVVQGTADTGVFPRDAEEIHRELAAEDKTLELIDGNHYFQKPRGIRPVVADLLERWVRDRIPG